MSRSGFAHQALIIAGSDFDARAPGGAVTVALCGAIEHEGACPLAPHHTSVVANGVEVTVRVVFAAEPSVENDVRARITAALETGSFRGPDGLVSQWTLEQHQTTTLNADELPLAERLLENG
jgi:hypothetical protein